jgi:microcystin degradation protein MlrC
MRIAVGCMMHESNTFTQPQTRLKDFDALWGDAIFMKCDGSRHPFGGIVDKLREREAKLVPTFYGRAMISGTVERDAYETMKKAIVEPIGEAGRLDGICLALHGSMYVDGVEDPEGDLLAAIRERVGPEVPIVCALDMHATVTERMISSANAFAAYRTAPHVDTYETGGRAAELLLDIIDNGLEVMTRCIRIPMLLCGEQSESSVSPMKDLLDLIEETVRDRNRIMNAEYLLGFPWADTPHHCVSVIVVGETAHHDELIETAEILAAKFWEQRHQFQYSTEAYPLDLCLDAALAFEGRPVIISDTGDNPTAGASENLTIVLKRLIERDIDDALVAVIADAVSREQCELAGVGAEISLKLGKLAQHPDALPLRAIARVHSLHTVMGIRTAVVTVSRIFVIITEQRVSVYDPEFIERLGLRLADFKLVVIKSGYMSPEYQRLSARKLFALTPGDTNIDMTAIPYTRLPRPIYPIDKDMHWEGKAFR